MENRQKGSKIDVLTFQYMLTNSSVLISEPDPSTVTIQNLTYTKLNSSTWEKYDYLISWRKPQFNESSVSTYAIKYKRTGNPDRVRRWQTKKVNFSAIS